MLKNLRLVLIILSAGYFSPVAAQNTPAIPDGIYYVVRHAEKDTGRNAALSEAGRKRAGDLFRRLENSHVRKLYTTNYLRTAMTADSLRIYQKIDTVFYAADTTAEGLLKALQKDSRQNGSVLIIGHSNTVPVILRRLGVKNIEDYAMKESEYNNFFTVEIRQGKVANFVKEQYGNGSY